MNQSILSKLEQLSMRLEEINALLSDQSVAADQNKFRELSIEHSQLTPVNEKYKEYLATLEDIETAEKLLNDLDSLSPFGQQNSEPIFKCSDLKISILKVFKEKHAKLVFSDNLGFSCEGMFFDTNILGLKNYLSNKSHFDCYFKVKKDTYSNDTVIHLEDIH